MKVGTAVKPGLKSGFGIMGFSTNDIILALWFSFLMVKNLHLLFTPMGIVVVFECLIFSLLISTVVFTHGFVSTFLKIE